MSGSKVRVRFAPSPTGYLHIGGVRTALYNWLFARHEGGEFVLRIEDTDKTRSTDESIEVILEGMKWLGMDHDGPIVRQTDRLEVYREYAEKLIESGDAYRCYCTKEEIDAMREEQKARKQTPHYDGHCRNRSDQPDGVPYCIRFKVPEGEPIEFDDIVYGNIKVDRRELDDLVIIKTDGNPSYNFANVVDDSDMHITHVIRGDDHINNTPRQIVIYQALGLGVPKFAHLPMLLDENKKRLSKRHGAANILGYRQEGVLPEALLNYIAKLGWGFGDEEFFSRKELIEKFTLDRVKKSACSIDPKKLRWLGGKHMEAAPLETVAKAWLDNAISEGLIDQQRADELWGSEWLNRAAESLKGRSKTLCDVFGIGKFYFCAPDSYEEKGMKKFLKPEIIPALEELYAGLEAMDESMPEEAQEKLFNSILEKYELKMLKLAQPVRLFLTGTTVSPSVYEVISLLGKKETLSRMAKGLEFVKLEE